MKARDLHLRIAEDEGVPEARKMAPQSRALRDCFKPNMVSDMYRRDGGKKEGRDEEDEMKDERERKERRREEKEKGD